MTRISIPLAVVLCTLGCSTKSSTKISVPAGASVQYGNYSTGTKVAVGPPLSDTLITKLNAEPDNAEKNAEMDLKTRTYLQVNGMTLQVNGNEIVLHDDWGIRTWKIKSIEAKLEALITKVPNKPDAGDEKQMEAANAQEKVDGRHANEATSAGETTATVASIQVVQTWQDLMNQPPTPLGTGTARLGIEAKRSPYRSGILLYCLTDGYSLPRKWRERCRLGPFKVEIQHERDTRERVQEGDAMMQDPPDIARSTALFRHSIPLDRPGKFLVRVLTLGGDLIAETEVIATRKEFHPWMPLQPSGQAQTLERDRGYDAEAHIANRAKGIAIPHFEGMTPMLFRSDGPEATVRKPAGERLPTLLPVDAGSGLTIEATAADLMIESKENIVLARPDWHFLVRWWVNGKAYIPDQLEQFKDENGMVIMGKKLLLHLDFVPHRIGAKPGDEVELQLLYCKHGWKLVESDMEMLSAHSLMAGPELLLSNRTRIVWEKNKNRQHIAPADADKPRR